MELNLKYSNSEDTKSKCLKESETVSSAHDDDINFVTFHPNKNILASCADDNLIRLWNIDKK